MERSAFRLEGFNVTWDDGWLVLTPLSMDARLELRSGYQMGAVPPSRGDMYAVFTLRESSLWDRFLLWLRR